MQQIELHLGGEVSAGVRGTDSHSVAGISAESVLCAGENEARRGCDARVNRGGKEPMDHQPSAVAFVVPGTPVGKGRPKFARRGAFTVAYTPEKTASYENLVKVKAEEAMVGLHVIDGAVAISISLYVTPPASWSQKKRRAALAGEIFPTTKPDWDNCGKGICDAMNEIVFKDDKQVVDAHVTKRYAETARAIVEVRLM